MNRARWVRDELLRADRILVVTGAGVSAESGVPTFRGEDGMWRERRPEELATPAAFAADPRLVWEWYAWRRELIGRCRTNAAHLALARLQLGRDEVTLVTQNVDGLHEAALLELGGAEAGPLPLAVHGSIFRVRCTGCGRRSPHRDPVDASSAETLPRCGACEALLRPDVVWFGESLDRELLQAATTAAREADVCLVVGTSALVEPVASLPRIARASGATLVEVNPRETPITPLADCSLRGPAGELLPQLVG